jgi:hypothetical protein
MTGCARIADCLAAVLSAVGPAKTEGPAKAGGLGRIAAAAAVSTASQTRAPVRILSNSINLVDIMISSPQSRLFPPVLTILDENQPQATQVPYHELLTRQTAISKSSSIKANQG